MDWNNLSPQLITFVCIGGAIVFAIFIAVVSMLPMIGIFGGLGWFINKRSKEAKAMQAAALRWPSTTGTIVTSRVEVSGGETTTVSPRIVYKYMVGAREFQAEQIRAGDKFMSSYSSRAAYDIVDKYPVGSEVTVYYNPANPEEAALER